MDEQAVGFSERGLVEGMSTDLVILSKEWKTMEFLHIAMATALFPYAKQYVLMKSLFDLGATQIVRSKRKLTK